MKHERRPREFTPEERELEHKRLQGFLDAYKKYPVSVMAGIPDPTQQQDDLQTLPTDS